MGISPITSLMMPLSNIRASYGSGNRILTVDGAIGILSSTIKEGAGVPLTEKEQNRLNAGHSAKYGMQDGKNDILMTNATVNWTPMSYPTKDLMLFEHIDSNFKIIIDAFGLNENIFSRKDSSKFSNLKEGLKLAYQDCIIPFAENVAKAFTKSFNLPEGEYLEIDYSHLSILKEDETVKSEVQKRKAETIKILNETGRSDLADMIEL
jgi:phage portal protein BeeE